MPTTPKPPAPRRADKPIPAPSTKPVTRPLDALAPQRGASRAPEDPRAPQPFDPQAVTLDQLKQEHPERRVWGKLWENFRLVYRGGQEFEASAADQYEVRTASATTSEQARILGSLVGWGIKPQRRFLHQMEGEPDNAYERRWARSVYVGYVGPVIDYFVGWLFSQPPVMRPEVEEEDEAPEPEDKAALPGTFKPLGAKSEEGDAEDAAPDESPPEDANLAAELEAARAEMGGASPSSENGPRFPGAENEGESDAPEMPDWWNSFATDCDGKGTAFEDFVRDRFRDVLQVRFGGWLVVTPENRMMTEAAADRLAIEGVRLIPFNAEQIIDWSHDEAGRLEWVKVRRVDTFCQFPHPRMMVETFYYVSRTEWHTWAVTSPQQSAGAQAPPSAAHAQRLQYLDGGEHNLGEVPFVWLEVPHGLWVMNKLYSSQINLFNQWSMLIHGQLLGAYLQPVLTTNEEGASGRVFGESSLIKLRAGGNGMNPEKFEWVSANTSPLDFNAKQIVVQRDEMYRIVHQMSLAVDAKASKDLGRSGESKKEDRRQTEVILNAFGGIVRDAMRRTLNLISRATGGESAPRFSCVGYDSFEVSDLTDEINNAMMIQSLNIPSKTFKRTLLTQIATGRLLGHLDEATKAQIADEIADGIEQEQEGQIQGMPDATDPFGQPIPPGADTDPTAMPEGDAPPDGEPAADPALEAELAAALEGEALDGASRPPRRRGKRGGRRVNGRKQPEPGADAAPME